MAALAIGLAGGGATFALGLGFGPGFFVGRIIGGLLFPAEPNVVTGPRRQDLRIQASTYGIAIPRLHATDRFAGNIIWSSGVRETVIETESGGKGFGAPKTVSRRFVYHVDLLSGCARGLSPESSRFLRTQSSYTTSRTLTPGRSAPMERRRFTLARRPSYRTR